MYFRQHYSGSSGNLYEVVANNGDKLLIEAGVKWSEVLEALDYDLKSVKGCLLSHEHL